MNIYGHYVFAKRKQFVLNTYVCMYVRMYVCLIAKTLNTFTVNSHCRGVCKLLETKLDTVNYNRFAKRTRSDFLRKSINRRFVVSPERSCG